MRVLYLADYHQFERPSGRLQSGGRQALKRNGCVALSVVLG
jgi:hypothetical protein